MADAINVLVSFDENYILPFQVLTESLVRTNVGEHFHIWLLHSAIPQNLLDDLERFCASHDVAFTALEVDQRLFEEAPITQRYPKEMYYRLLAPFMLPEEIERIIYLDPDILVINAVRPLWELDLGDRTFAAASHAEIFNMIHETGKRRLGRDHDYFNSGVMLIDLERARHLVVAEDIFKVVNKHAAGQLLPDQDVFNKLYGDHTLQIPDVKWNYDTRYFSEYLHNSDRKCDMDCIMQNTVFLHYCGKQKPWRAPFSGHFSSVYKHYVNLVLKHLERIG